MPVSLIVNNNLDHRTKAELELRKEAEKSLITGEKMRIWPAVRANPVAKKEFRRVIRILEAIGKNDAMYEGVINRYAMLKAECEDFQRVRDDMVDSRERLEQDYREKGSIEASTYYQLIAKMQMNIVSVDKQIMAKRNMLLAIEKENIMTISGAMRAVPKKAENRKKSAMEEYRMRKAEGQNV